ncbi:helix-turn-helix domain-containing protein [Blastococcus sp. CCUG 61487]|uniref:helix-turn-helix domain-containing protein n=1 Tax=Blastococcus sp. CCUG 61487 TaxID=1840703 RepID=UPI0010C0B71A|nr:hypothetical protein A6V29_04395 [Blastococcus sp. CCUG 61487]
MSQVPRLLTTSEVAQALRVDPGTVRRWASNGQIDHVRLPSGGLRFPSTVLNGMTAPAAS